MHRLQNSFVHGSKVERFVVITASRRMNYSVVVPLPENPFQLFLYAHKKHNKTKRLEACRGMSLNSLSLLLQERRMRK